MPHASHRMDLALVPSDLGRALDEARYQALTQAWEARGWVKSGAPGPEADALIEGGFRRLRLDRPPRLSLYANQQGGFRVACPSTGGDAATAFGKATQRWREGGPRTLRCPSCGDEHPLEAMVLSPPGAFGLWAVIVADCDALHLRPDAMLELGHALGPMVAVSRRVG